MVFVSTIITCHKVEEMVQYLQTHTCLVVRCNVETSHTIGQQVCTNWIILVVFCVSIKQLTQGRIQELERGRGVPRAQTC